MKRITSILPALILCLTLCAPALASGEAEEASAEQEQQEIAEIVEEIIEESAEEPALDSEISGTCGELSWMYTDDGTLTISGTGDMIPEPGGTLYDYGWLHVNIFQQAKRIVIEDGVTSIGGGAFYGFSHVESVSIPASVTKIGEGAFGTCGSLRELVFPEGLGEIAAHMCEGCSALERVYIPISVKSVGYNAFDACTALETVDYEGSDEHWDAIEFAERNAALIFAYKGGVHGENNDNITWRLSTDGTLSIYGTGKISPIGDDDGMPVYAWNPYYLQVHSIVISEGVTAIGNFAFGLLGNAESVSLPESLVSIAGAAFSGTGITELHLPAALTEIGDGAFFYCHDLKKLSYDGTEEQWNAIRIGVDNEILTLLREGRIEGVTEEGALWVLSSDGVLSIKGSTRRLSDRDELWWTLRGTIRSIVFEDGLRGIAQGLFSMFDRLESVTLPASLEYIEPYVFADCWSLTDIYYHGTAEEWAQIDYDRKEYPLSRVEVHFLTAETTPADAAALLVQENYAQAAALLRQTVGLPADIG